MGKELLRMMSWVLMVRKFVKELHLLSDCNAAVSQQRKKRQVPPTLAPLDAIERYTQLSSYHLHKTNKAGILSIDVHQSKGIIATGGIDTNAVVFSRSKWENISTLSGHSTKTVRLWQQSENGNMVASTS